MKKLLKRFWWIPVIVLGIIGLFSVIIIGNQPAYLGSGGATGETNNQVKLTNAFKADPRHVVKLLSNYYYTTYTKQQVIDENEKIIARLAEIKKEADDKWGWFGEYTNITQRNNYEKALRKQITYTYGTDLTFFDRNETVIQYYAHQPEEWYENAFAAKQAGKITTVEQLNHVK